MALSTRLSLTFCLLALNGCSSAGSGGAAVPCDDAGTCSSPGLVCVQGYCVAPEGGLGGGGGSGGGSTGGSSFGGAGGFGGASGFGGVSGFGGASGFGGVSGFGGSSGTSGFGGTGGFGGSSGTGAVGGSGGVGGTGATGGTSGTGGSGGTAGVGNCCSVHSTTGCTNSAIQSCVCASDGYCCNTSWDSTCVSDVETYACGSCGGGSAGSGGSGGSGGGTGQQCGSVTCGSAATCCTCSGQPICITLPSGYTCSSWSSTCS